MTLCIPFIQYVESISYDTWTFGSIKGHGCTSPQGPYTTVSQVHGSILVGRSRVLLGPHCPFRSEKNTNVKIWVFATLDKIGSFRDCVLSADPSLPGHRLVYALGHSLQWARILPLFIHRFCVVANGRMEYGVYKVERLRLKKH